MEASENKVVSIIYELRKGNMEGEVVEVIDHGNPLTFLMGRGNLLPKFEEKLFGLKNGDTFRFALSSDEAYGPVHENAIVDVPMNIFVVNGKTDRNLLQIGNVIPMMDNEGRRLDGIIKEINADTVTMDFNHPMAGSSLFFKGEITEIRNATEEEMSHGHIHHTCGCGGGCASGEGSDKNCSAENCGCGDEEHSMESSHTGCSCGSVHS